MTEVYQPTAYRSDAIPDLPAGGHPKMDRAFERLAWGHYEMPLIPDTVEIQLAYAGLFQEPGDAEDGFPWGEQAFAISKGFLNSLQGALYITYMCAAVLFYIAFLPLSVSLISVLINNFTTSGFYNYFMCSLPFI